MSGSISTGCNFIGWIPRRAWPVLGLLSANLSLFLGSAAAFAAPQNHTDKADSSNPVRIAIVGATLINPAKSQVLENAIVTIEGNRILAVAQARTGEVRANTRVIDARGK